jgi:hypothetical protein
VPSAGPLARHLGNPHSPSITEHDGYTKRPASFDVVNPDALALTAGQNLENRGAENANVSPHEMASATPVPTPGAAAAAPTATPEVIVSARNAAFNRSIIWSGEVCGWLQRRVMWRPVDGSWSVST